MVSRACSKQVADQRRFARREEGETRKKGEELKRGTDEAVALGAAGELVGDDDGLEDVAVALEVLAECVLVGLPRQPAHEYLGERGVPERRCRRWRWLCQRQWLRMRRHHRHCRRRPPRYYASFPDDDDEMCGTKGMQTEGGRGEATG